MYSFPVVCGIIFILNGAIQLLRREYVAGSIWVFLGTLSLLTHNMRELENFQFSDLRRLSVKAISFGIALTIAVALFGYQIFRDYTAKNSLNKDRAEHIQRRQ
ncbi:hypothetical protein [Microseira sp. BLCC-F43]|jgi:hypothetical protein|uniref:hypothetical protein n=1 Tax=Microseira sp. BLCC-F43 TaxID=3153602 RepID=UPI0035BB36EF